LQPYHSGFWLQYNAEYNLKNMKNEESTLYARQTFDQPPSLLFIPAVGTRMMYGSYFTRYCNEYRHNKISETRLGSRLVDLTNSR
jgi:hypothetical protein